MSLKNHRNQLYSFDGVYESLEGKNMLVDFLYLLYQKSEIVMCACQRPACNTSVKELIKGNHNLEYEIDDFLYDNFSLSFTYVTDFSKKEVLNFLADCFYFFQYPQFIFLSSKDDIDDCKKFISQRSDWAENDMKFKGCFVFKGIEDDVLWFNDKMDSVDWLEYIKLNGS